MHNTIIQVRNGQLAAHVPFLPYHFIFKVLRNNYSSNLFICFLKTQARVSECKNCIFSVNVEYKLFGFMSVLV